MFEAQKQAINQLKKQIQKTLIQTPFSGTIDSVIVKLGGCLSWKIKLNDVIKYG